MTSSLCKALSSAVLFLLCYLSLPWPSFAVENQTIDFPSFTFQNFTLLGDSYLRNGTVGLTKEVQVPSTSAGSVVCKTPINLFDPAANASASFSSSFSFMISSLNLGSSGDGITFFLSSDETTLGSAGSYLGVFDSAHDDSLKKKKKLIAIEFDTHQDPEFSDPNSNHVGLDTQSTPNSTVTANASSFGINLSNGSWITAWIDYNSVQKELFVSLSYSNLKPKDHILSANIDLSQHFDESMYAGFSAATEGSTGIHCIRFLKFEILWSLSSSPTFRRGGNAPNPEIGNIPATSPVSSAEESAQKSHQKLVMLLAITGPVAFLAFLIFLGWFSFRRMEIGAGKQHLKPDIIKGPRKFSYRELSCATRGFDSSRILGRGAFGTVYKATLHSGATFAVKKSKHNHQCRDEFMAELSIIACLRHRNLLQLQGWCGEKGELLLVYEYMPNGSLDKILYQELKPAKTALRWSQRYNISVGIAAALTYLHQECEQQVIHRDIKAGNIMLDKNFSPRLGDFGLARLMDHDKSPVSTLTAGTIGYLAPEYLQYGKATEKTDVYSYGVLILEIACGRRPIEKDPESHMMINLVDWTWGLHSEEKLLAAVDPRLGGDFVEDEMRKLLLVGLSCTHPDDNRRPSMRRVLHILNNEAELLVVPRKKPVLSFSNSLSLSVDDIFSESEDDLPSSELKLV